MKKRMPDSLKKNFKELFGLTVVDFYDNWIMGLRFLKGSDNPEFHKFSRISYFAIKADENSFFINNGHNLAGVLCFEFAESDKVGFLFTKSVADALFYFSELETHVEIGKSFNLISENDFLILDIQKIK